MNKINWVRWNGAVAHINAYLLAIERAIWERKREGLK